MKTCTTIAAVMVLLAAGAAHASVADSAANGFTIKITLNIQAAPDEVYKKLMHNVGDFWDPAHTFSHNAHNLSIEEKAMGCWCEKLPDGGVARHLEVLFLMPGEMARFGGALGPMQAMGATGSLTFQFTPAEGGATKVDLTYAAGGYMPGGLNTLAPIVDMVLGQQLARLKNYVEHGDPAFKAPAPGSR